MFLHSKYSITFGENIKIFLTFPYQLMIIETEGPGDLQGQTQSDWTKDLSINKMTFTFYDSQTSDLWFPSITREFYVHNINEQRHFQGRNNNTTLYIQSIITKPPSGISNKKLMVNSVSTFICINLTNFVKQWIANFQFRL